MRKVLGYVWLKSTPSTAVQKCEDGVCAEGTRRCWSVLAAASSRTIARMAERTCGGAVGREEGIRSRGSSSCLQGNEITRCESVFSMALIAAVWNGSCTQARLGTVLSSKVRLSRGLPQGAPEPPVIFTVIMELVLRDLIESWITRKLAWRLDDFVLAAICSADDVVLVAASVAAAEVMVAEVIAKSERGWSVCWCTANTLDKSPEDDGQKRCCGRIGCAVGGGP